MVRVTVSQKNICTIHIQGKFSNAFLQIRKRFREIETSIDQQIPVLTSYHITIETS